MRLADALNHLYVLLPVLDDAKHYWVSNDEVDKLIRAGAGWLASHPEKELISRRYLAHRRELTQSALARLAEVDDTEAEELDNAPDGAVALDTPDRPVPLARAAPRRRARGDPGLRRPAGRRPGLRRGRAGSDLLAEPDIEQVVAADVSARALQIAGRGCAWTRCPSSSVAGWRSSSPR